MSQSFGTNNETLKLIEKKARQVYKDSMRIFREGVKGLEVVADKTVEATKIRLANQKALHAIRSLFADLGNRVYDAIPYQKNGFIKITPDISAFAEQITRFQRMIESNVGKLKKFSAVGHAPKPAAKKKSRVSPQRRKTKTLRSKAAKKK